MEVISRFSIGEDVWLPFTVKAIHYRDPDKGCEYELELAVSPGDYIRTDTTVPSSVVDGHTKYIKDLQKAARFASSEGNFYL